MNLSKYSQLSLILLILIFAGPDATVKATPATNLHLSILPLQCDIEIVDDGFSEKAHTFTEPCEIMMDRYNLHIKI